MTKKDESPEEATNPYWSDELLAVLAESFFGSHCEAELTD